MKISYAITVCNEIEEIKYIHIYNKMIRLTDILKEVKQEKSKTLLNECFITDQFLDLFIENPKIFNILNNNLLDMDGNVIKYNNKNSLANELSVWGGSMGYDGVWHWNKPKVLEFFKDLHETGSLSNSNYSMLVNELKKDYKVFTIGYMENLIEKLGIETSKLEGDDWWYQYAKQSLEFIKKGLTQSDFINKHKNKPIPNTCRI